MSRSMSSAAADRRAEEYDVYIYSAPQNGKDATYQKGREKWEKKRSTTNRLRALAAARKLHESDKYRRVEIKMKTYDPVSRRTAARTFKVYEGGAKAAKKKNAAVYRVAAALAFAGLAALALALI